MRQAALSFVIILVCHSLWAKASWHDQLLAKLEQVIKNSNLPRTNFGLQVSYQELDKETPLLGINNENSFAPASITKLVTAAAALNTFPPGHQFVTQLYTENLPLGESQKGSLYIKGGGDPGFVSEDLWVLVNDFTRTGIKKIEGDIVVDDSMFDGERFDPGRDQDRVDRAYDAPIGALSFNWNSVNVYVRPTEVGKPVKVVVDPETNQFVVVVKAKTVKGDKKQIAVERETIGDKDTITVTGTIGTGIAEAVIYKSIVKPDIWTGEHLRGFLAQRGITVVGKVRPGAVPASASLAAEHKSKPLGTIVSDMMKWSNNFVAEMLTKNLGALSGEKPATMNGGLAQLKKYLIGIGVPENKFTLESPSGLSRKNQFRPMDLHKVLTTVHNNFKFMPEYFAALPIAGVDGTLRERMKKGPAAGWVRAKTGLLTGVVALAGFAGRPDGTLFTFVFIFNGKGEQTWIARDTMDVLASTLVMGK